MLWSYCIPINISHKFSLKRLIAIIHIQLNKISMIVKCFHVNWFSTVLYAEFYNYLTNQQSDDFFTNEVLFQITATLILQLVQHTALGPHCTFNTRTCDQSFFFSRRLPTLTIEYRHINIQWYVLHTHWIPAAVEDPVLYTFFLTFSETLPAQSQEPSVCPWCWNAAFPPAD